MSAWTSLFCSTLSMRAFSTLRILPRIGRIAWVLGSRACRADPPAESPSTTNSSQFSGSRLEQSMSLPGRPPPPSSPLRLRARSRALRAAIRAWLAETALRAISLPSAGFASNQSPSCSYTTDCTNVLASVLPSLVFVCPSNCGSRSFTLTMAVRPSRMSSPDRFASFSLSMFHVAREPVHQLGQRGAEALLVGATLGGVDRVGEGVDALGEAVVPLHGDLSGDALVGVLGARTR